MWVKTIINHPFGNGKHITDFFWWWLMVNLAASCTLMNQHSMHRLFHLGTSLDSISNADPNGLSAVRWFGSGFFGTKKLGIVSMIEMGVTKKDEGIYDLWDKNGLLNQLGSHFNHCLPKKIHGISRDNYCWLWIRDGRAHWWTERCHWGLLSFSLFLWLSIYLSIYLSSMFLFNYRSIYRSIYLSFICLSV